MEIVPKRKWQYPIALEREYARLLVAYVEKELEIVEEFLPEMVDSVYRNSVRNDAVGDWLGNLVDRVQRKVKEKLTPLVAIRKTFQQVNRFVSTQMTETIESLFGSKPRQFNNTRQFEMIQTIWTSQNLELVKSIDTQIMEKLRFMMSQRIIHAASKPELTEQLTKEIQELAGVTRNRAALIAADQVGKLNSQLTQYRQVNAGIEEYIWNTRKDNRVRPAHITREGKRYKWSEPPSDGHPGWAIRCRCTALPLIDTDKTMLKPNTGSYLSANTSVQNTPTDSIIKVGTPSGALNPYSERAEKHAIQYYETVRNRKTDTERIANNTGFAEKDIEAVRQYIFFEKHDLGINGVRRFFPSYMMAESWRRMFEGKDIQPHDLILIKHELLERQYMMAGIPQNIAHEKAEQKYNYRKEAEEYHAKISGRKKNE